MVQCQLDNKLNNSNGFFFFFDLNNTIQQWNVPFTPRMRELQWSQTTAGIETQVGRCDMLETTRGGPTKRLKADQLND